MRVSLMHYHGGPYRRIQAVSDRFAEARRVIERGSVLEDLRDWKLAFEAIVFAYWKAAPPDFALPDLRALHAAMVADGFRVKTVYVPPKSLGNWRFGYEWLWKMVEYADGVLREAHGYRWSCRYTRRSFPGFSHTLAWLDEHAAFVEHGRAHDGLVDAAEVVAEKVRFALLERSAELKAAEARLSEAKQQAELEAVAAADAKRAKAYARKRASFLVKYDEDRLAGRFQGHAEMVSGFFFGASALDRPRWTYLIVGEDGALYCGSTFYLRRRLRQHGAGVGALVTSMKPQRWFLLHAEKHENGQTANFVETSLLRSQVLQDALLAQCQGRVMRLHRRFRIAVPWLGLGSRERDPEAVAEETRVRRRKVAKELATYAKYASRRRAPSRV